MARMVVDRPQTLAVTFLDGEEPVDAGAVTVAASRYDGTVHLVETAATPVAGETGRYTVLMPAVDDVDRLQVHWSSGTAGEVFQLVDVTGGRYVDLAALAAAPGVSGVGHAAPQFDADDRADAAEAAEDLVNEVCGPFVAWFALELVPTRSRALMLSETRVQRILSASRADEPLDHADWTIHGTGLIRGVSLADDVTVEIAYVHGRAHLPADVQRACQALARQLLLDDGRYMTDRARGVRDEFGVTFLSTPGEDRPTGLPMIDATLNRYARAGIAVG